MDTKLFRQLHAYITERNDAENPTPLLRHAPFCKHNNITFVLEDKARIAFNMLLEMMRPIIVGTDYEKHPTVKNIFAVHKNSDWTIWPSFGFEKDCDEQRCRLVIHEFLNVILGKMLLVIKVLDEVEKK